MDKRDLSYLGKEIKDLIKNSVYSMDFNKINKDVGSKVNSALDIAFEEVRRAIGSIQMDSQRIKSKPIPQTQNNMMQKKTQVSVPHVSVPHVAVGKVAGTLLTVFGSLGIGILGTAVVVLGVVANSATIVLGLLPFLAGSVIMEMKGTYLRNRVKRFRRYLSFFNGRSICMIKELSSGSGLSERFLVKDLRKMIQVGMFPQAHIDDKKSVIMLNRQSYENYLSDQAVTQAQQLEADQRNNQLKKSKGSNGRVEKEVWTTIDEGKSYIRQIREANDAIRDEIVSNKLVRMEQIISKIIDYVEFHPLQLSEIRKFMEYYLPTTLKLLNAYKEFENQPYQGDNITTAKNEIQNILDTINGAFENLFDSLFESAAWDVSTDISVLETMLAQEGLTEKDFK